MIFFSLANVAVDMVDTSELWTGKCQERLPQPRTFHNDVFSDIQLVKLLVN